MRAFACALVLFGAACAGDAAPIDVPFRVRLPVEAPGSPTANATRLSLAVLEHGVLVPGSETALDFPTTALRLPPLPFGDDYAIDVEVQAGALLLARGRSFPFSVSRRGATPEPDLFLGTIGLFGRRLEASAGAATVAVLPTREGALCALADGTLRRFRPFADEPFEPVPLEDGPLVDATFRAVGARLLAGFDADGKRLSIFTPEGEIASVVEGPLVDRHGAGAMLVADPAGQFLFLLGGADEGGATDPTAVTRVDLADPEAPVLAALAGLPSARWSGTAVWVVGRLGAFQRVLVLGGESGAPTTDEAFLVDVRDPGASVALPSPVGVAGATVLAIGEGQVVVIGGGAADDVQLLLVDISPAPSLTATDPAPPPLALRRERPKLVEYTEGVVLVVGGVEGGDTVPLAELVDLRVFPGDVVSTGALPADVDAPLPVLLGDESVWVFDPRGTYGFVPPR